MKIKQIEINNLKAIDHLSANIDGHHILVTGKNRQGKSTFLQSLLFGLGFKGQSPPVRDGQQKGDVHIWSVDGYEFESEKDIHKGVTKVSVKLPGEKGFDTKVSSVGAVVGEIIFDPFEFAELSKSDKGRKDQIEEVKNLLTQEERELLAKSQRDIKANEESRTQTGKDRDKLKGAVSAKNIQPQDLIEYAEPVKVAELMEQKRLADEHNTKRDGIKERRDERELKITELQKQLVELSQKQVEADKWLAENKEKPVAVLNKKINDSSDHNTMCEKVKTYLQEKEQLKKLEDEYGHETALIESQREAYKDAIRSLALPIPDLFFDDEQLIWNGRPVNPDVLSTSEIMGLGFMIRMAKAPKCEVVVIHRGESFDRESLNDLIDQADAYGLQLFVEKVVDDQEELKLEFLTKSE
jgi:hypothetical protein